MVFVMQMTCWNNFLVWVLPNNSSLGRLMKPQKHHFSWKRTFSILIIWDEFLWGWVLKCKNSSFWCQKTSLNYWSWCLNDLWTLIKVMNFWYLKNLFFKLRILILNIKFFIIIAMSHNVSWLFIMIITLTKTNLQR